MAELFYIFRKFSQCLVGNWQMKKIAQAQDGFKEAEI
jgi:hypothetical protein